MWVPLQLATDVVMNDELACSSSSTGSSEIVWKVQGALSSPEAVDQLNAEVVAR